MSIIQKAKAGFQDLLFGSGTVTQTRNNTEYTINKINGSLIPYSGDADDGDVVSINTKIDTKLGTTDIIDNLTSTDTDKALSANQGKVLSNQDKVLSTKDTSQDAEIALKAPIASPTFTGNPKAPTKEEKGGSTEEETKEAGIKGNCSDCGKPNFLCICKGDDSDKEDCSDKEEKEAKVEEKDKEEKEAEVKEEDKEEKEVKEAGKTERGKRDGTGPFEGSAQKEISDEGKRKQRGEKCPNEEKEASKKVEFVKIANLDEKNKGFLKEYWRQLFGDDYVNALTADK